MSQNIKKGNFSADFVETYEMYFNQNVILNKNWVPNIVCKSCYNRLMDWKNRRRETMPFGIPMTWTNPGDGHNPLNCYACANKGATLRKRERKSYNYAGVASAATPLPHSDHIPVPKASSPDIVSSMTAPTFAPTYGLSDDTSYNPEPSVSNQPILINQNKLDSIVAKLELTQHKSEELASFLKSNNVLAPGVKVTAYRSRQATLQTLFVVNDEKTSAYCPDVGKLMDAMEIKYEADDWRLFIDSSKLSLKAVLLHKTNKKPSVPIAYSTETKETYDALENILKMVNYAKHMWRICCDLKVVAMLCGLQSGYIKYMCFLCDWDTRFTGDQYACHEWKLREHSRLQTANIIREPLVPKEKILLPPLHIKLGIVKNFIKTVAKRDGVFLCLKLIYPRLSESKIKEGKL